MSASIRAPWLHDYLLQIAEENGGNLISVAFESKGRRAQLVKWLTYPQDDDKEVFMWAIISDKVHTVEVRFSKEAVKSLRQNPLFLGRNVTEYRTAIVIIKTFRPFCTRVPQGRDKGMSLSEHICLEVNDFSLSGAFNEPVWGSPRPIGTQSDIREWVQGLRQGGGAGNVLKLRKAANSADVVAPAESVQGDPERAHLEEIPPKLNPRKVMLAARKPVLANPPIELPAQRTEPTHVETKDNSTGVYLRKWKLFEVRKKYLPVPDNVLENLRALPFVVNGSALTEPASADVAGETEASSHTGTPLRETPRCNALFLGAEPGTPGSRHSEQTEEPLPNTPSQWSPSSRGSPLRATPAVRSDTSLPASPNASPDRNSPRPTPPREGSELPGPATAEVPTPISPDPATAPAPTFSSWSAPTPAQRPRITPSSSSPTMPLTAQEVTASAVMESPLAAPLSSAPPPALPLPLHRRRVPRPVCHSIVRDPNLSGPVVVLVPDSDTSASLSQNQPFSQPSQQNTSLQEKSQDQKQSERSQQSLSYATDSQGDHSSKSDPKSQGSQQSRLRHEITAAVDEIVEGPVSSEAVVAEGSSQAVEPSQPVGAQPSSPPATVPDDAPDQGASPRKPEDVRDLTSVKPPPVRTRSKVTIPSPQEVPDSEDETEEDTGDEHDELESAAGTDIVSRRSAPLDSDDAKTKAMVDKYTAKPTTEVTAERVRERIGQSSSASDLPAGTPQRKEPSSAPRRLSRRKEDTTASLAHSRSSELPLPPSSPDVFMSEDSFHASQASFLKKAVRPRRTLHKQSTPRAPTTSVCDTQLSDTRKAPATREVDTVSSDRMRVDMLPPPSTHDPEAWKEPAFMRKPSPVQADKPVSKASVAIQVDPPKRRRSPSPASEPERPPPKRRKTSTVSATRTSEWASRYAKTTDVIPPPRPRDTRPMLPPVPNRQPIAGPSTSFKQVDLPRSSSITSSVPSIARKRSTSGRSASSDKSTIAKPEVKIVRQLSPGGSTPVEIKHVDFRAGTRRSSLASISRTKTRSHPSADITPSNARGHRTTMVGYDTAPSTSRLGDRSRPVDPSPSTMKRASHVSTTYMMPMVKPRSARQNPTSSSSHNPPKPGGSSSMVKTKEGPSAATAAPPQKQLLGGYKVNLDMKREEGGPPPMTWARLQEILVSTGRARYKLKKEKEVREAKSNQDRRGGAG